MFTHENYIEMVAHIATKRLSDEDRARLNGLKLAYGAGPAGVRGVTYYDRWGNPDSKAPFVEVCAFAQESLVQLAGTTIHELAHVLAGFDAGHGPGWKDACGRLGLNRVKAAGTRYLWSMFARDVREPIANLPTPDDGAPVPSLFNGFAVRPRPCAAGIGTKGGKSRGTGSGSRLRKFECDCRPPVIVRASRDELRATCNDCLAGFHRA